MADKVVVIFIEGETEVEFYKEIVKIIRKHNNDHLNCIVETKNVSGIGNYKTKVTRIFEKDIKKKYANRNHSFHVVLCHDHDVFKLAKKPPIDWASVRKDLIAKGANRVSLVAAKDCIEDWFLYDEAGLLAFLGLKADTPIPRKGSGTETLEALFKKKNRLYVKGTKSADLVATLNVGKILSHICEEIKPLCKALGLSCKDNLCSQTFCAKKDPLSTQKRKKKSS